MGNYFFFVQMNATFFFKGRFTICAILKEILSCPMNFSQTWHKASMGTWNLKNHNLELVNDKILRDIDKIQTSPPGLLGPISTKRCTKHALV